MATVIPIEVFELLERKVGREEAKEVVKAIESSLETIEKKADAVALQKKLELKDELTKELATKADLLVLEGKIDSRIVELEGKIERLNLKLNFLVVLTVIALTLMNPVMAEIIKGWLKI